MVGGKGAAQVRRMPPPAKIRRCSCGIHRTRILQALELAARVMFAALEAAVDGGGVDSVDDDCRLHDCIQLCRWGHGPMTHTILVPERIRAAAPHVGSKWMGGTERLLHLAGSCRGGP